MSLPPPSSGTASLQILFRASRVSRVKLLSLRDPHARGCRTICFIYLRNPFHRQRVPHYCYYSIYMSSCNIADKMVLKGLHRQVYEREGGLFVYYAQTPVITYNQR